MPTLAEKKAEQRERHILRIMSTCVHFTGIQHSACKAGVNYHEQFGNEAGCFANIPCTHWNDETLKQCAKVQYPTREEAEAEERENEALIAKHLQAMRLAHEDAKKKGFGRGHGGFGELKCPLCSNGTLRYSVASCNGHMHAACTDGCVSWME